MRRRILLLVRAVGLVAAAVGCRRAPVRADRSSQDSGSVVKPIGRYVYRVRKGDTLDRLGTYFYGEEDQWVVLGKANGLTLKQDDPLRPGSLLHVPRLSDELMVPPFEGPHPIHICPGIALAVDIDGDGTAEKLEFATLRARSQFPDGNGDPTVVPIHCTVSEGGKELHRFEADKARYCCEVTVQDLIVWRVSKTHVIVVIKTLHDARAATASEEGKVHFFLMDSRLRTTKLFSMKGDGQWHGSASSGGRQATTVRLLRRRGQPVFAVRHLYEWGESEVKEGFIYNRISTETTTYTLTFDRKARRLVKGPVKVERDKKVEKNKYNPRPWMITESPLP